MRFPEVLSHTKIKDQDFAKLLRHSLRCLIARTQIPNGVEDFLNTYAQKRSDVDQRQCHVGYPNINTVGANAPKAPPKQARCARRAPAPPPPPRSTPPQCLHVHLLMILIMWRVPVMGLKRLTMTRPWRCLMKMWKWDIVHRVGIKLLVLFVVKGRLNFVQLSGFLTSLYYLLS